MILNLCDSWLFPIVQAWVSATNRASVDEAEPIDAVTAAKFHTKLFFPVNEEECDPNSIAPQPETYMKLGCTLTFTVPRL